MVDVCTDVLWLRPGGWFVGCVWLRQLTSYRYYMTMQAVLSVRRSGYRYGMSNIPTWMRMNVCVLLCVGKNNQNTTTNIYLYNII